MSWAPRLRSLSSKSCKVRMEVVEDWSRTTILAEYEVYRKITATKRNMVMMRPESPFASIVEPKGRKFFQIIARV